MTSGYVIPDVIADDYKVYHFDLLVYDEISAPILWMDSDYDSSEQGKRRAIPAKHVLSAFEIKASLTRQGAIDAMTKLNQFNELVGYLPQVFSSGIVFFDLDPGLADSQTILPNLIPSNPIIGYWGGIVLRCSLDQDMTGLMQLLPLPDNKEEAKTLAIPIAKSINDLAIRRDESGNVSISEQGAGVMAFAGPDKQWHFSKLYGPIVYGDQFGLSLHWSHNGFATFALDLLSRLEGRTPFRERPYMFGQVFDDIP